MTLLYQLLPPTFAGSVIVLVTFEGQIVQSRRISDGRRTEADSRVRSLWIRVKSVQATQSLGLSSVILLKSCFAHHG